MQSPLLTKYLKNAFFLSSGIVSEISSISDKRYSIIVVFFVNFLNSIKKGIPNELFIRLINRNFIIVLFPMPALSTIKIRLLYF